MTAAAATHPADAGRRDARRQQTEAAIAHLVALGALVAEPVGTAWWLARPEAPARAVRLWPHNGAVFEPASLSLTINAGLAGALARLDAPEEADRC
jgi:hypothetical protein